jgi:hypothetical protein
MASEKRRACGFRKINGLYMCSDGLGAPCCKLPIILHICPTCNHGVKQTRGWQWIDPRPWLIGTCMEHLDGICAAASPDLLGDRVGLLWIGEQFYPTPSSFQKEAAEMGVSRRIVTIPRGFKLGESWVFLAHPKVKETVDPVTGNVEWQGGVFRIFKPTRIEKIVTETQSKDEAEMAKLADAGITPVIVKDDDKDHMGSVFDKDEEDEKQGVLI